MQLFLWFNAQTVPKPTDEPVHFCKIRPIFDFLNDVSVGLPIFTAFFGGVHVSS